MEDFITSREGEKFVHVTHGSIYFPRVVIELEKRSTYYVDQEPLIQRIKRKNSDVRCEFLLNGSAPQTMVVFEKKLTDTYSINMEKSLKLEAFIAIEKNSNVIINMAKTLQRIIDIAKKYEVKTIYLRCSDKDVLTMNFLEENNFTTVKTYFCKNNYREFLMVKKIDYNIKVNSLENEPLDTKVTGTESDKTVQTTHLGKNNDLNYLTYTVKDRKEIEYIRKGKVTVYARLNTRFFQRWHKGMIVRFNNYTHPEDVFVKIIRKSRYGNFRKMLESEGVKNCVPFVYTVREGLEHYYANNMHRNMEMCGVLAFEIKKVDKIEELKEEFV